MQASNAAVLASRSPLRTAASEAAGRGPKPGDEGFRDHPAPTQSPQSTRLPLLPNVSSSALEVRGAAPAAGGMSGNVALGELHALQQEILLIEGSLSKLKGNQVPPPFHTPRHSWLEQLTLFNLSVDACMCVVVPPIISIRGKGGALRVDNQLVGPGVGRTEHSDDM